MTPIRSDTISTAAVIGELVECAAVPESMCRSMFRLLDEHFEGATFEQFRRDLLEKNWVILLRRPDGDLVGFSTLLVNQTSAGDEPVSVVYSGDTIVRREAWNSSALPRTWIESVNRLRPLQSRGKYYWLLLTSGFRTYRLLPVFWREFYPRYDLPMPQDVKELTDRLAGERFGARYDPGSGIVRLEHPQVLRGEAGTIPPRRLDDPHVAFFVRRNPGHCRGDELVCLCELSKQNLTPAGRRMAGV